MLGERIEATKLGGLTFVAGRPRRQVQRNDRHYLELYLEISTFVVEFLVTISTNDFFRFFFRVNSNAAVAFLDCILVVAVITGRRKAFVDQLVHLRLGFLDTNDVGILIPHPLEETFARRCPYAIGV